MSGVLPSEPGSANVSSDASAPALAEIDSSCRLPLLVVFLSAAVWLVLGWVFELIASLQFHAPTLSADIAWLSYGRVRPAFVHSILYGFCVQAGLGVGLWLLARLGRTRLAQPWLVTVGAIFWNLGVTVGVAGILVGDGIGFENIEMPGYSALIVFLGYIMVGLWGALTFHRRRERPLFAAQWFLFAALFWFPWIYSTAELLLEAFPVRGVTQSVIAWWYSNNLLTVWLGLVGLGAVFYFVPKLLNRELHSHYLALFTFWVLILFGSWGGIPSTAPVPAWMPVMSTVATVLTILVLLSVGLNVYPTAGRVFAPASAGTPLQFIMVGVAAFIIAGLMKIVGMLMDTSQELHFTWFSSATTELHIYGFFAMVMFGAIYYVLPQLTGMEFPYAKLVRAHFWVVVAGIVLIVGSLAIGGVAQGLELQNAEVAFLKIVKSTLPFLRVSTVGDLLLLLGHLLFLGNLVGLATRFARARLAPAYAAATMDLYKPAEAKP